MKFTHSMSHGLTLNNVNYDWYTLRDELECEYSGIEVDGEEFARQTIKELFKINNDNLITTDLIVDFEDIIDNYHIVEIY